MTPVQWAWNAELDGDMPPLCRLILVWIATHLTPGEDRWIAYGYNNELSEALGVTAQAIRKNARKLKAARLIDYGYDPIFSKSTGEIVNRPRWWRLEKP